MNTTYSTSDTAAAQATAVVPRLMRAVTFHETGGPEVLQVEEVPVPEPSDTQVLIQVTHAGVNFAEVMFRRGQLGVTLPHVPGLEAAGHVVAVGTDVTSVRPGDRVVALTLAGGGYAELAVAEERHTIVLAGELGALSSEIAVGSVCNVTTAWGAVHLAGRPEVGDRVVVLAAAGGVGSAVSSLAAAAGAHVTGVVGSDVKRGGLPSEVFAERLTYDELLASSTAYDVVFDAVGGPARAALVSRVTVGGRYVAFGNAAQADTSRALDEVWLSGATYAGYNLGALAHARPDLLAEHLRAALGSVADGTVVVEPAVVPVAAVVDVHRSLEARETVGKVVLDVAQGDDAWT